MSPGRPYRLEPLPGVFGAEVHGIDLKQDVPFDVVEAIKVDVTRRGQSIAATACPTACWPADRRWCARGTTRHRLLVFRDQGLVSAERQVDLSHWFGPCDSTFCQHPRAEHHNVFRVSNDPEEGITSGCHTLQLQPTPDGIAHEAASDGAACTPADRAQPAQASQVWAEAAGTSTAASSGSPSPTPSIILLAYPER